MKEIKLYTIKEVAHILKVTPQTARKYINDGKLTGSKIGGKWLVSEKALLSFLKLL